MQLVAHQQITRAHGSRRETTLAQFLVHYTAPQHEGATSLFQG
jgi:hypothetical protein